MRFPTITLLILYAFIELGSPAHVFAQEWGTVSGTISDADSARPLQGVSVTVDGTNFGTGSQKDGSYRLRLPPGRYSLNFSTIGYQPQRDSVLVESSVTTQLNVVLRAGTIPMDGVTIEDALLPETGVYRLDPETIRNMPMPVRDVLRALKVVPGVATNNELSNQYSVRGGGFNENLLFVNNFEIFLPFRPRAGEQEGLSLLNGEMAEHVTFYSGGFPVRYGGKLSSAVDVEYRRPNETGEALNGSAHVSLLDMGITLGTSLLENRVGVLLGLRKARPSRFFGTQELKGNYLPEYTDFQGLFTFAISPNHEIDVLGIIADHSFSLDPSSRKTYFGTISQNSELAPTDLQALWTQFDDRSFEEDGYETRFGAIRLSDRFSSRFRLNHSASYFETLESEKLLLAGSSILFQVEPGDPNPDSGSGLYPIGLSRQEDAADNRVAIQTLTLDGRYQLTSETHALEAGWSIRRLYFDDRLNEKSIIIGRSTEGSPVRIVADSLRDAAKLDSWQASLHVEDTVDFLKSNPGRFLVTGGIRSDYFAFTEEWTFSPRVSMQLKYSRRSSMFGSIGVYHQAPSYRELRGKPEVGVPILGALNTELRSQRSIQFVAGIEHFLEARRFSLRAETYYKRLSDVITYDVENVRVAYSGDNDADGFAYGLDLQLRGEFVPGLESWVNYGYLVAKEVFKPSFQNEFNAGSIPRPSDQRHTLSLFIQDYIPRDPTWKIYMRTLFGSGFPYTPPVPGSQIGNILIQAPGPRMSARYPRYFRFDMGITKHVIASAPGAARPVIIEFSAEILNVFDMTNTVAYSWTPNAEGIWTRIPTRLTPRTVNVRIRVTY